MQVVGHVAQLWRYPVKSMVGERRPQVELGPEGVVGDRLWAVRDLEAGEIRGAKAIPALLRCVARYRSEPEGGAAPPVDVTLPSGARTASDADGLEGDLERELGRRCRLEALRPATDARHFRNARRRSVAETRALFGLERGEALPDLSHVPTRLLAELGAYATPRGTYVDLFPLHLITTASLETVSAAAPDVDLDVRRFRPSLLVQTASGVAGLAEFGWCGGTLVIGEARIAVVAPTVRCSMPSRAQPGGVEADKGVLRALSAHSDRHLGVYARVARAGRVREGDEVGFLPDPRPQAVRGALDLGRRAKRVALGLVARTLYRG